MLTEKDKEKQLKRKARRLKKLAQLKINNSLKKKLFGHLYFKGCFYCKKVFLFKSLTIEHKVPLSLGGTSSPDNIELACRNCNSENGKKSFHIFQLQIKQKFRLIGENVR